MPLTSSGGTSVGQSWGANLPGLGREMIECAASLSPSDHPKPPARGLSTEKPHGDVPSLQYAVPVTKYDRKGFRARQRQLLLTQKAAYVVELAKVKQKINYAALRGRTQPQPARQLLNPSGSGLQWETRV